MAKLTLTYAFIYHKNSQQEKLTFFTYEVSLNGLVIFLTKEEKDGVGFLYSNILRDNYYRVASLSNFTLLLQKSKYKV